MHIEYNLQFTWILLTLIKFIYLFKNKENVINYRNV